MEAEAVETCLISKERPRTMWSSFSGGHISLFSILTKVSRVIQLSLESRLSGSVVEERVQVLMPGVHAGGADRNQNFLGKLIQCVRLARHRFQPLKRLEFVGRNKVSRRLAVACHGDWATPRCLAVAAEMLCQLPGADLFQSMAPREMIPAHTSRGKS